IGIVGVVSVHLVPLFHAAGNLARLTALAVVPGHQRKGVGRALVAAAEAFAWQRDCRRVEVTRGDQRAGAHTFYRALGFARGTWVKESDRTPDERTRTYIMVDVIADTLKRIEAAGGRVLTPRTNIGSGMGAFAVFADPVGNEFGLYEEPSR